MALRATAHVGHGVAPGGVAFAEMRIPRLRAARLAREEPVLVGDPRLDEFEVVETFGEQPTALAWRDQLRHLGLDAYCTADHPLDRLGRGDIYLVVPADQWSRANEIVENLDD